MSYDSSVHHTNRANSVHHTNRANLSEPDTCPAGVPPAVRRSWIHRCIIDYTQQNVGMLPLILVVESRSPVFSPLWYRVYVFYNSYSRVLRSKVHRSHYTDYSYM